MGSRYIYGREKDLIQDRLTPDCFFEFHANEFRKIYCCLGLFVEYSQSSYLSFDDYLNKLGIYPKDASDPELEWKYIRKGVCFTRDRIIPEVNGTSQIKCSGVMLKKLAYKRRGVPAAIPSNADKIVDSIIKYVCTQFVCLDIRDCFLQFIAADVLRKNDSVSKNMLTRMNCRNALLGFQIDMLQSRGTERSRRLLYRLLNIPTYDYIISSTIRLPIVHSQKAILQVGVD